MKQITTDDLRRMEDPEGIILQGCGGDPQEWVDGINDLFTEAGILLNSSTFQAENVSVFRHGELTNMLFPFEGVDLAVGRLAMWRIQTHGQFGGTWLSDFVVAKSAPSISAYGENSVRSLAPPLPTRPASPSSRGDPSFNRLGGFLSEPPAPAKPSMNLIGEDGNIFSIMGRASGLLREAGLKEQATEMVGRVTSCGDYYQAINIISEYVDTELSDHSQPQKSHNKKGKNAHER